MAFAEHKEKMQQQQHLYVLHDNAMTQSRRGGMGGVLGWTGDGGRGAGGRGEGQKRREQL